MTRSRPLVLDRPTAGEAHVDMPAGVAGIIGMWKAHRKGAKVVARMPATVADKLVERCVEHRRIHRFAKRFLTVIAEPDDRPRPGLPVDGIASRVAPEDGAAFLGKLAREGLVQPDEAVLDKFGLVVRRSARAPVELYSKA